MSQESERTWRALTRIAEALERLVTLQEQMLQLELQAQTPDPPTQEPPACPHPEDQRVSFGRTNGVEDWQCRLCGYRTVTTEA